MKLRRENAEKAEKADGALFAPVSADLTNAQMTEQLMSPKKCRL